MSANTFASSIEHLPARQVRRYAEPLVLLHGWGCDRRSWQPLLQRLNQCLDLLLVDLPEFGAGEYAGECIASPEAWLDQLLVQLPERFVLLGWSLGGMLATRLAAQAPKRVLGLMTLASNVKFVASADWPDAMADEVFLQFQAGFAETPAVTLKRFAGLMARGDRQERQLLKGLREACEASWQKAVGFGGKSDLCWQATLNWLAMLDNRVPFSRLTVPGRHWLAEADALVPVAIAKRLQSLNSRQDIRVVDGVGHALHWSAPLVDELLAFVDSVHYAVDKRKVAQSFGRAASQYDSVAGLQRQIGHRLLIAASATAADTCLDLGCGTGYFTPYLAAGCRNLLAMDLSEGMLGYARKRLQSEADTAAGSGTNVYWLGGDAEAMPVASAAVDTLYSSLAIQWCANLSALFQEVSRVLKADGRAYLATLGPDTLKELRQAWSAVDRYTHVNHFASEVDLRAAIHSAGLQVRDWQSEEIVLHYEQVRELTYELKTLGAHNMNHGQSSGLTGRQRLQAFKQAYEQFRLANGKLPATYDVFYLELSH